MDFRIVGSLRLWECKVFESAKSTFLLLINRQPPVNRSQMHYSNLLYNSQQSVCLFFIASRLIKINWPRYLWVMYFLAPSAAETAKFVQKGATSEHLSASQHHWSLIPRLVVKGELEGESMIINDDDGCMKIILIASKKHQSLSFSVKVVCLRLERNKLPLKQNEANIVK